MLDDVFELKKRKSEQPVAQKEKVEEVAQELEEEQDDVKSQNESYEVIEDEPEEQKNENMLNMNMSEYEHLS